MNSFTLLPNEKTVFNLRSLYDRYGYSRYKMNKFEEYDLYARNKDFLISDSVITFTDTNGKLMALKPDVTLSIVKNTRDDVDGIRKLYYNENVYRVSKGTHSFREIMQMGLEALGKIDAYCIYEVLQLAAASLQCIERNCILEISHLGILSEMIDYVRIPAQDRGAILRCIGEKNVHELTAACRRLDIDEEKIELLRSLVSLYGTPDEVLPKLEALADGIVKPETLGQFIRIVSRLNTWERSKMLRIDFSVVDNMRYYNGFVFKGFAEGIPTSVLSGGQYDVLMRRMGRESGAIGFAIYLDLLEQGASGETEFDVDNLIIYDDGADFAEIERIRDKCMANGESVSVQRQAPAGKTCRRLIRLKNGEVEIIENHA